jgi:hypothetical protein
LKEILRTGGVLKEFLRIGGVSKEVLGTGGCESNLSLGIVAYFIVFWIIQSFHSYLRAMGWAYKNGALFVEGIMK